MKFLLWALFIGAVVLFVLQARRGARTRDSRALGEAESMVRCAHCGIYVPESEAIAGPAGRVYCSDAHRRLDGGA